MIKPKIVERKRNTVSFQSLDNNLFFYENILGSIHLLNDKSKDLKKKIEDVNTGKREFEFEENIISKRLKNLDTLVFNCTEACNLNCSYCIYSGSYTNERKHNSKNKISLKIASKALNEFMKKAINTPHIMFYGGEPLLEGSFIRDIMGHVKKTFNKEVSFGMTTNFTLARSYLDFFAKNNFLLAVSLDGFLELHDEWRVDKKGKGSFNRIMDNLKILADKYPEYFEKRVALSVTLTDPTKLIELKEFFSNNDLLSTLPINTQAIERNFLTSDKVLANFTVEKMAEAESQYWRLAQEYCDNVLNERKTSNFEKSLFDMSLHQVYSRKTGKINNSIYPQGMCIPGTRKLFVNGLGEYYMCEKIGNRLKLGNVEKGLNETLVKQALSEFCQIRDTLCQDCWAYRDCLACAASAKDENEISIKGQTQNCERFEQMIFTGFSIYSYILRHKDGEERLDEYFKDYQIMEVKNG